MLRQRVIGEWSNLREIIHNNQQSQWGQLLARLGIRSLAPHLSIELVTEEISQRIKKNNEQTQKVIELRNREFKWSESFRKLKEKANIEEEPRMIHPHTGDLVDDLRHRLKETDTEMKRWKNNFDYLKEMIYFFEPRFDEDDYDEESGPTIEEVD